jgi:hypothetical protein
MPTSQLATKKYIPETRGPPGGFCQVPALQVPWYAQQGVSTSCHARAVLPNIFKNSTLLPRHEIQRPTHT